MRKKIFLTGVAIIMFLGLLAGCGGSPTEAARSGAYTTKKSWEYAVVYENTLSVFIGEQCYVFQLTRDGDSYVGENIRATARIKFSGDELTIVLKGANGHHVQQMKLRLKRNADIFVSETAAVRVEPPSATISGSHGLQWRFDDLQGLGESVLTLLRNNGILGAAVEVKSAGKDNFELVVIIDFYPEPDCLFTVNFNDLSLVQGENIVRVRHIGGAFIQDDKVCLSENSEAVSFRVMVDAQGNMTVEEI